MQKQHVKLSTQDKSAIAELLEKGSLKVRTQTRARGLLYLDEGKTYREVSKLLGVAYQTVSSWSKKYVSNGLDFLTDNPRSGRPLQIDGVQRAKITALACSEPPEGYIRWSVRLLADHSVELGYVNSISHTEIANILKKTNLNLTGNATGASEK